MLFAIVLNVCEPLQQNTSFLEVCSATFCSVMNSASGRWTVSTVIGGSENDGHENDGPSKCPGMKLTDMKMQDMKMQDMKMQDMFQVSE